MTLNFTPGRPVCAMSTTMMALRITWFPLCLGENGRGMKGGEGRERGKQRGREAGTAGGAKSGFKLRDNVVAPRRPQRAGSAARARPSVGLCPDSQPLGRTDGRTDHNVARRERQFTSRTAAAAAADSASAGREARGRQCTHEHQVGGTREERERKERRSIEILGSNYGAVKLWPRGPTTSDKLRRGNAQQRGAPSSRESRPSNVGRKCFCTLLFVPHFSILTAVGNEDLRESGRVAPSQRRRTDILGFLSSLSLLFALIPFLRTPHPSCRSHVPISQHSTTRRNGVGVNKSELLPLCPSHRPDRGVALRSIHIHVFKQEDDARRRSFLSSCSLRCS